MANTPEPYSSFDDALSNMNETHLHCRDYGHSWRPHTARFLRREQVYEQTLRCTRCRTARRRTISADGDIVGSSYDYAEHYLVKGVGRLTGHERAALRLASVNADMRTTPTPLRRKAAS
jgi:hypothetical protein